MAALSKQASDVRINEVDLSSTISQSSNIVAALVAVSSRGPIGPTLYTSFDKFRTDFGEPSARVSYDHYSAEGYFKEGQQLYVRRALGTGAATGGAIVYRDSSGDAISLPTTFADVSNIDWSAVPSGATPLFAVYGRKGPGSYTGAYSLAVTSNNLPPPTGVAGSSSSSGGSLTAGSYLYRVAAINSEGNETVASAQTTVVVSAVTGTASVTITWDAVENAIGYRIYGRSGTTLYSLGYVGSATYAFTDSGLITPDTTLSPITNAANLKVSTAFKLAVYDDAYNPSVPVESYDCTLDEQVDEQGLQTEIEQRVTPYSEYIGIKSYVPMLASVPMVYSMDRSYFGSGTAGAAPTASQINAAWQAFSNKEMYAIDCLINSGKTAVTIQKAMDTLATKRFDCVAFLDLPSSAQKAQAAVDYRRLDLNINSSFSALFGSDLYVLDPVNGKQLYVPPSGYMAGLMARTTRVAQPWFSMAGLNRGLLDVVSVRNSYEDGEATVLAQNQVNYMRKFIGRGIPLWEQSTLLNKNSALQFLNVRVLCNVIKRSLYDYLLYSMQEPGDEVLRKSIKYGLEEYLNYVQAARGIKSYIVQCDETNNLPILVNSGITAVGVYIVPILGTRQINLTLLVGKQGLQVTEADLAVLAAG